MDELPQLQESCLELFETHFEEVHKLTIGYAPGRVNLIGEHTDYNNGYVFPMALANKGTMVLGCKASDGFVNMATLASVEQSNFSYINDITELRDIPLWARYVVGVIKCFEELTGESVSVNLAVASNLPMGAGLSSSASLEVSVFSMLEKLYDCTSISPIDKIKACQKAEHVYANVPCGIMDQYIATLGAVGHALFINCENNDYESVPFGDPNLVLVITDTHKKHELAGGEYAKRRATCEAVSKSMNVGSLAEVDLQQLEKYFNSSDRSKDLPPISYNRARHVVTEIDRARKAKECLKRGDMATFGELMNSSHKSLAGDYEVTCTELDEVVQVAWDTEGVLGSRMTGGGFGGCAITLVEAASVSDLLTRLKHQCPYSTSFSTTAGMGSKAWELIRN